ncbi:ester cyclase [Streptomyces sp. NPDC056470]|uniref:ester cyclase n=1 Tax=Streptomyces sp. NPDC056470 TaxID=3345831 RepID=UPI0036CF7FBF
MSQKTDVVTGIFDACNKRDWTALARLIPDDFSFYDNTLGTGGIGPQAFVDHLKFYSARMSDDRVIDIECVESERLVTAVASSMGTHDGEDFLPGLTASGRRAGVRFVNLFRFTEQGELASYEAFWNMLTYLVELGHTTIAPSALRDMHPEVPPVEAIHYV